MSLLKKGTLSVLSSSVKLFLEPKRFVNRTVMVSVCWGCQSDKNTQMLIEQRDRSRPKSWSFMQMGLRSAGRQSASILKIHWKKGNSLEINFKRYCTKTLIFVFWSVTNYQDLWRPRQILQYNSNILPLIRT